MTETKTLNGSLKVHQNYGPSIANVLFSWLFYGMFRIALYRFLFPWSFFGLALNYILLFSAISVTFRALFTPRYRYSFQAEVGAEDPSISHEHFSESSTFTHSERSIKEQEIKSNSITPTGPKTESIPTPLAAKAEQDFIKKPEADKIDPPPLRGIDFKTKPTEEKVQFCSYCGVEVPDYARFCSSCGERLR